MPPRRSKRAAAAAVQEEEPAPAAKTGDDCRNDGFDCLTDCNVDLLAKRVTKKAPAAKAPAKKPAAKKPAAKKPAAKKAAAASDEVDVDDRMHALAAQKGSKLRPNAKARPRPLENCRVCWLLWQIIS